MKKVVIGALVVGVLAIGALSMGTSPAQSLATSPSILDAQRVRALVHIALKDPKTAPQVARGITFETPNNISAVPYPNNKGIVVRVGAAVQELCQELLRNPASPEHLVEFTLNAQRFDGKDAPAKADLCGVGSRLEFAYSAE